MNRDEKCIEILRDLHPPPWTLGPLRGKYYATKILDANGNEVLSIKNSYDSEQPSTRQEVETGTYDLETYCDDHWENKNDYALACWIVSLFNNIP
jgi:hypothetical protein